MIDHWSSSTQLCRVSQATLSNILAAAESSIEMLPDNQYKTSLHPEGKEAYRKSILEVSTSVTQLAAASCLLLVC